MITRFDTIHVRDRQQDGRTDRQTLHDGIARQHLVFVEDLPGVHFVIVFMTEILYGLSYAVSSHISYVHVSNHNHNHNHKFNQLTQRVTSGLQL